MWVTHVSMFTELNVYRVVSIAMPGNLHICSLKFEQRRILFELQAHKLRVTMMRMKARVASNPRLSWRTIEFAVVVCHHLVVRETIGGLLRQIKGLWHFLWLSKFVLDREVHVPAA